MSSKSYLPETARRFLMLFLPVAFLVVGVSMILFAFKENSVRSIIKGRETFWISEQNQKIQILLQGVISDLRILASNEGIRALVENPGEPHATGEIKAAFLAFVRFRGQYNQVRVINSAGKEFIRVNYNSGRPGIVPEEALQYKGRRYYLRETLSLEKGEIFISPMDLNMEHGTIEKPLKPVIRVGTPVFDTRGQRRGIVILSYLAVGLLDNLGQLPFNTTPGRVQLLNSDGYWLKAPDPEDEWGFVLEERKDSTFESRYPRAWKTVSTDESGQFLTKEGLFTFTTIHPTSSASRAGPGVSPLPQGSGISSWKLVSRVSPQDLQVLTRSFLNVVLLVGLVVLLLHGTGSWFLARAWEDSELKKEKIARITASMKAAAIMIDETGRIIFWNPAAERIFGYTPEEVLGKPIHGLITPERYHEAAHRGFASFHKTGQGPIIGKTLELAGLRKNGEEFPLELSVSSLRMRGRHYAVGLIHDISERKRAEEGLKAANAELRQTVEDLEKAQAMLVRSEKLAAIGTLSSGVAHEILNPLNIISAIAQIMRKEGPEGQLKEDVDEVLHQVQRATKITNNLRAFAHQREAEIKEVDVHALFDETAGLIEYDLRLDNIEIQREYTKDLPIIRADEDQLAQVFLNLLTNARDAMKGGKDNKVILRTAVVDGGIEIRFTDTGPGIPADIADRIFDPFFTTKDPDKGTGLGLSLVHSIIEKLGGTLRLESEPGQGAQFIITLRQEGPENEKNP